MCCLVSLLYFVICLFVFSNLSFCQNHGSRSPFASRSDGRFKVDPVWLWYTKDYYISIISLISTILFCSIRFSSTLPVLFIISDRVVIIFPSTENNTHTITAREIPPPLRRSDGRFKRDPAWLCYLFTCVVWFVCCICLYASSFFQIYVFVKITAGEVPSPLGPTVASSATPRGLQNIARILISTSK